MFIWGLGKTMKNAFTLIELLVVVAIIGLLVAFSLVALNSYKRKGEDAAIKIDLIQIRSTASLLYDDHPNGFEEVCDDTDNTLREDGKLGEIEDNIERKGGVVFCRDEFLSYAVISSLKAADCWCIDSTGISKDIILGIGETCSSKLTGTICP